MKSTNKRIIFIFISLFVFLLSIFIYSHFVRNAYSDAKYLKGELISKTQNLNYYKNVISKIQSFMSKLNNDSALISRISLIIPKKPNIGYFTNQIVELAQINGLTIKSLSTTINASIPSKVNSVYGLGDIMATFRADGSYAGLKSFIKQLQENILIMNIKVLRIGHSSLDESQTLDFNISIVSYYQTK